MLNTGQIWLTCAWECNGLFCKALKKHAAHLGSLALTNLLGKKPLVARVLRALKLRWFVSTMPMQQLCLGVVHAGNGLIVLLWELLNNIRCGLIASLGINAMNKWMLLINSGQRWYWKLKWMIVLPLCIWYNSCKGEMVYVGFIFGLFGTFHQRAETLQCLMMNKNKGIMFWIQWNCFDELQLLQGVGSDGTKPHHVLQYDVRNLDCLVNSNRSCQRPHSLTCLQCFLWMLIF